MILPFLFFIIRNTFFLFFWFLTKISYVIDVDCFQLSLTIWTFSTGLWCDSGSSSSNEPETAKMESPFEYKPKTSSQTCTLARRSYSQISSLVGWLGCGRYSLLVFRFWNVTSTNHVSFGCFLCTIEVVHFFVIMFYKQCCLLLLTLRIDLNI